MDRSIKAGVYGFMLAIIINLLLASLLTLPDILSFIPSFVAAIFTIYISRLETLKDGLVAAFMTYIFSDGILGTIVLATSYFANEPYPSFNIDVWIMLSPVVQAVTAVIAGYIGVRLAQKRKPAQELPLSPPPQLPPV
jgi:uncharacterized membrane protein YdcZ (DUF606 family)